MGRRWSGPGAIGTVVAVATIGAVVALVPGADAGLLDTGYLVVETTSLDFGSVSTTLSAAMGVEESRSVVVRNAGGTAITSLVQGSPNNGFSRNVAGGTCGSTLAAGATCTMSYLFKPTAVAAATSTTSITSSAGSAALTLTGRGVDRFPLKVTQTALEFGNVRSHNSRTLPVTVTNTSASAVTFVPVLTSTPSGFALGSGGASGCTLAPGASCDLPVAYTGPAASSVSSTLGLTLYLGSGALFGQYPSRSFSISASAAPTSAVVVSPRRLDFGLVPVGTTSAPQNITVTNTSGATVSVSVNVPTVTNYDGSTTCSGALAAGASCTVSFAYRPAAVTSNGLPSVASPSLGTVIAGATVSTPITLLATPVDSLVVRSRSLNFGEVVTGTTAADQVVSVVNTTAATIPFVATVSAPTGPFTVVNGCTGGSLAADASCDITYRFAPAALGAATGSSTISLDYTANTTAATRDVAVSLAGTSVAAQTFPLEVSPRTIDFGTQGVGTTSPIHSVTVRNTSAATVPFTVSGTGGSQFFTFATTCGTSLAAGASCRFDYRHQGSVAGVRSLSGNYSFTIGGTTTLVPFSVTGTAVDALVTSTADLEWGLVWVDGTGAASDPSPQDVPAARNLTFTNTSRQSLTLTSSAGITAPAGLTIVSNTCATPLTLAGGASCSVALTPAPTSEGAASVTMTPVFFSGPTAFPFGSRSFKWTGAFPLKMQTGIAHGTVLTGGSSTQNVVVANLSGHTQNFSVTTPAPANTAFTVGGNCPASLAGLATCTLALTYTPSAAGSATGSQSVTLGLGNSMSRTFTVAQTGAGSTGAAELTITDNGLRFAPAASGATAQRTVTLQNTGNRELTGVTIANGTSADGLSLTGACPTIAAGASCDLTANFMGNGSGTTATLTAQVQSSAGTKTVTLTGLHLPNDPPGAPTGVTAVAGDGFATVSWTAPTSDGGFPITGYTITPFADGVAQAPQTFDATPTSRVVTGLTNGLSYTFTVAATSSVGTGAASAPSSAVTPIGPQTLAFSPEPPATLAVGSSAPVGVTATSGLTATLAVTGSCTFDAGTLTATGVGTCTITASQAGNAAYLPADDITASVEVSRLAQTIDFGPLPATLPLGATVELSATADSGLPVSYLAAGACTVDAATLTVTAVGTCSVTASQAGNATYAPAADVTRSTPTARAQQTITVAPTPAGVVIGGTVVIAATASSGLAVSLAVSGPCTLTGSTVKPTTAGACVVTATQAGNATYEPATPVTRTIQGLRTQTITLAALPTNMSTGSTFTVTATASSGLPVTLSASGPCTLDGTASGATGTVTGAGSCTVTANQAGDATWAAAPAVSRTVPVRGAQTITFAPLPVAPPVGTLVAMQAVSSSGLAVTLSAAGGCTANGATLRLTQAGVPCTVTAAQSGGTFYLPAEPVVRTTTPVAGPQAITIGTLPSGLSVGATFPVTATASSGLAVALAASGACSIDGTTTGSTVTIDATGTCTVTAAQTGDANWLPAPTAVRTTIVKATQTLTFDDLPANPAVGSAFTLRATSTSGLTVVYTANGGCTVVNSTLRFTSASGCTVTATQPGNAYYLPAAPVARSNAAVAGPQTITVTTLPSGLTVGSTFTVGASASSGLPVTLAAAGSCTIAGASDVTIVATGLCTITATQAGNGDWLPATPVLRTTIVRNAQTITFGALPANPAVGTALQLTATSSSGLGVSYSAVGGCSVVNSTLRFTLATASCTVTATQGGNAYYLAAPPVVRTTVAVAGSQIITIGALPVGLGVGSTFSIGSTATSGLPVSLSASGACTAEPSTGTLAVTVTATGTCTVTASQAGNANWLAATTLTRTTIVKAAQTITFPDLPASPAVGSTFTMTATASSGGGVTYTTSGACTSVNSTLRFVTAGATCTVTATQGGTPFYDPAAPVVRTTTPVRGPQSISPGSLPQNLSVGATFVVTASATSGLPVGLVASGACTLDGNATGATATIVGSGTCAIAVSQAGDDNWLPAPTVNRTTVVRAPQTITFSDLPASPAAGSTITLTASSTAGIGITYTAVGGCTIVNFTRLRFDTAGASCTVTATQPGNATFLPAEPVARSTTVAG